jgi:hypothetical protein
MNGFVSTRVRGRPDTHRPKIAPTSIPDACRPSKKNPLRQRRGQRGSNQLCGSRRPKKRIPTKALPFTPENTTPSLSAGLSCYFPVCIWVTIPPFFDHIWSEGKIPASADLSATNSDSGNPLSPAPARPGPSASRVAAHAIAVLVRGSGPNPVGSIPDGLARNPPSWHVPTRPLRRRTRPPLTHQPRCPAASPQPVVVSARAGNAIATRCSL